MKKEFRGIEWKVGIFMLTGLCVIAVMAIKFGKLSQGLQNYYTIVAEFPNASGLLKGQRTYISLARVSDSLRMPRNSFKAGMLFPFN